jgi:ribonuclease P protein component
LLKRKDFLRLSYSGKRVGNKYFTALYLKSKKDKSRLGITASKRVGNAVVRNRMKRLVREYFRLNKRELKKIIDISVIVKKNSAYLTTKEAFSALEYLFKKVVSDCDN